MKAKLMRAALPVALGANTSYALGERDVTSEGDATITEQQKLGPNVVTYQAGNARITTRTGGEFRQQIVPSRRAQLNPRAEDRSSDQYLPRLL